MKLTTSERNQIILRLVKEEGLTTQEVLRRFKSDSKIYEAFNNRFADKLEREIKLAENSKLGLRGSKPYTELRKMLREYVGTASPAKLHEAYGGKPAGLPDVFKSGKVRNIYEAIELYTGTKQYVGPAIDSWTAERHFLNQDKGLVKQAREYVKRIGLEFK